jgi:hypothetical protein
LREEEITLLEEEVLLGHKQPLESGGELPAAAQPGHHGSQDNRWDHRHRLHRGQPAAAVSDRDFMPFVEHLGLEAT